VPDPLPPAERLVALLQRLTHLVVTRGAFGLPQALIGLIIDRIRGIKQPLARIAARVQAGTFRPRRSGPRRTPENPKPRTPDPLPREFGWLLKLVPEAVQSAGRLEFLFRDPEVVALLEAAPATFRRPLRALCRMLRVAPPDIFALPKKPRTPRVKKPPAAKPPPLAWYPPTPPEAPAWMHGFPHKTRWRSFGRIRGSPKKT
jgi:hypothetical protein